MKKATNECDTYAYMYVTCLSGVDCPLPVSGGPELEPVPQDLDMMYQDRYIYECIAGYYTHNHSVVTCLSDGTLSLTTPPTCIRK